MKKDKAHLCGNYAPEVKIGSGCLHGFSMALERGSMGCVGKLHPRMNAVWHGWETHASKDGMYQ